MSNITDSEFGRLRSIFWPIHSRECRKLVPMLLMVFFICFDYSILRCMKDAVVVTASGAKVIPFIKVWALLPMAVILTYLYAKLSDWLSQERVFYVILSGFLIFYSLFAFVLYPMRDFLHPTASADHLALLVPTGLSGLVEMYRNWTFTLFYVISELWGSMVLGVLFWGIANEVTRVSEARRFYGVFGVGSNIAAIIAGQAANYFSQGTNYNPNLPFGSDAWEQTLMTLVLVIITGGFLAMICFRWMNKTVLRDPEFDALHQTKKEIKKKKKLSMKESFSFLSNSKYLVCIAVIVVSYNLTINLVEVVWKDYLRQLYSSPTDFHTYINNLTSMIGLVSTITALFIPQMLDRMGWTKTALITPIIMLVTCSGFFSFIIFHDTLSGVAVALTGFTPLAIAIFFGSTQNCLSKAAKYSVFDATKEMSFIPLEHELKLKGKAAIDGVGSRFGKSGGSLIHQGLLVLFGTLTASVPYLAGFLTLVIICWAIATRTLGQMFQEKVKQQGETVEIHEPNEKIVTA